MIRFGTDGWRGVISREFTFENVRKVAQAHAEVLKREGAKRVVVGYDLRFLSEEYGKLVAEVMAGNGFEVDLSNSFCPTPAVSYNTKYGGYDNGIVITASHNFGKYNGYKVKESFWGAARTEFTKKIEAEIPKVGGKNVTGKYNLKDLVTPYVEGVRSQVELSLFLEKPVKIVHDPMFGAQQGLLKRALSGTKAEVFEIHAYRDPLFGGKHPEPIVEENISCLLYTSPSPRD
jgi:phosphomannomutase